jgi:diaminopimelate epimerase
MELRFFKYHGAGNDFVIVDEREHITELTEKQIAHVCNRRFGVGADGFMRLQNSDDFDFKMLYYNADGKESTMCGNGGRCMIAFANHLGLIDQSTYFEAVDGEHEGQVIEYGIESVVRLKMLTVGKVDINADQIFLDTGSPHHIEIVEDVKNTDVDKDGKFWRHHNQYAEIGGCNANFVEILDADHLYVRTFERGVEAETFSCGTGVTAAAISLHALGKVNGEKIQIDTLGGKLQVEFSHNDSAYEHIHLQGPAAFVYQGIIDL